MAAALPNIPPRSLLVLLVILLLAGSAESVAGPINSALDRLVRSPTQSSHAVLSAVSAAGGLERELRLLLEWATRNATLLAPAGRAQQGSVQRLWDVAQRAAQLAVEPAAAAVADHVAAVSTQKKIASWPAVRRLLVAALALRYLQHGLLDAASEAAAAQLLVMLWEAHRTAVARKGAIEFMHVSKSGGTSFCQLSQLNGCTAPGTDRDNCLNPRFHDTPRYVNLIYHDRLRRAAGNATSCDAPFKPVKRRRQLHSCAWRRRVLLQHNQTLYANEFTAFGGEHGPADAHACSNLCTVLQLRHPHPRVVSHIKHVWWAYGAHCREDRHVFFPGEHNTSHWSRLMPAALNNYLIRSLLGESVFVRYRTTEAHLQLARTLLAQQYDVLLVLEDEQLSAAALRWGLGWRMATAVHVNTAPTDEGNPLPRDMDKLWALNELDVQLYEHGVAMARLDRVMYDTVEALAAGGAVQLGPKSRRRRDRSSEPGVEGGGGADPGSAAAGGAADEVEEEQEQEEGVARPGDLATAAAGMEVVVVGGGGGGGGGGNATQAPTSEVQGGFAGGGAAPSSAVHRRRLVEVQRRTRRAQAPPLPPNATGPSMAACGFVGEGRTGEPG